MKLSSSRSPRPPINERPTCGPTSRRDRGNSQAGFSIVEMLVAVGVLSIVMSLAFRSSSELIEATQRNSAQSYATSRARGAMDLVVRFLRNDR